MLTKKVLLKEALYVKWLIVRFLLLQATTSFVLQGVNFF